MARALPINVPNQITLGRLLLAVAYFALLSTVDARQLDASRYLLNIAFWVFIVAALSDILDGYLARRMDSVTSFGRILDPVVDKVIICGGFVLFASAHFWDGTRNVTGVGAWMAVVILSRELLVSAVRAHAEGAGQDFAASWAGKLKMFVQSVTMAAILARLAWNLTVLGPLCTVLVWLTVVVTAASALSYINQARPFLLTSGALGGRRSEPTRTPRSRTQAEHVP